VEPASVGIVLDSSVIIAAERRGHIVREILEQLKAVQGEIEIGVSVVTIAELVHGAYRTKTQVQQQRLEFIERLSSDVPVHPVTLAIARLAGRIEGQQGAIGVQFAFEGFADRRDSVASRLRSRDAEPPGFPENPGPFRNPTLND
jgi:predicted nucleic acid-binding protein